jgi:predicted DNA-binding transcriptional regulator YafY
VPVASPTSSAVPARDAHAKLSTPTDSSCAAVEVNPDLLLSTVSPRSENANVSSTLPPLSERRPDSQQLIRQWALLRLLSDATEPYSVKQLADQLQTSKATIDRDLATLERDFALIEEQAGKQKKVYRLAQTVKELESLKFGISELLAIYAAHAALVGIAGTPIHDDLLAVTTKIRGLLSKHHNGGLEALVRVFAPHPRGTVDYREHDEVIDDLSDAVARRRVCELTYRAAGKKADRTHRVRPLKVVLHRSAIYVLACVGEHQRITTFAVHRIRALTKTNEEFTPPKVDVDAHVAKAFGIFVNDREEDVEIVFDDDVAWKLEERTYHPHEQKHRRADGKLVYRIRSSAQWEVIPWVQTFGPFAELVAPASWRDALQANLDAMKSKYSSAAPA